MKILFLLLLLLPGWGQAQLDSTFRSSQTPGTINTFYDDGPYELGTTFQVEEPGTLVAYQYYASVAGHFKFTIYEDKTPLLITNTYNLSPGWNKLPVQLLSPIRLKPGHEYAATVYTEKYYDSRNYYFSQTRTSNGGKIVSTKGSFHRGSEGYPEETYRNSCYYVGVVVDFTPIPDTAEIVYLGTDSLYLPLDTGAGVKLDYQLQLPTDQVKPGLTYSWREFGDTIPPPIGPGFTYSFPGSNLYYCMGKDSQGKIVYYGFKHVMVFLNPKQPIIELLADGTYQLKEGVFILRPLNAFPSKEFLPGLNELK